MLTGNNNHIYIGIHLLYICWHMAFKMLQPFFCQECRTSGSIKRNHLWFTSAEFFYVYGNKSPNELQ